MGCWDEDGHTPLRAPVGARSCGGGCDCHAWEEAGPDARVSVAPMRFLDADHHGSPELAEQGRSLAPALRRAGVDQPAKVPRGHPEPAADGVEAMVEVGERPTADKGAPRGTGRRPLTMEPGRVN